VKNKKLMSCLHELKGKTLGCYCWPLPCHGDVLISLLKRQKKQGSLKGHRFGLMKH